MFSAVSGTSPISAAVPFPDLRTEALKRYLVDLTTKGSSDASVPENLTAMELKEAYDLGKLELPVGDEPLMAYYFNAFPLFIKCQAQMPICSAMNPSTPLGGFFLRNDFILTVSVLQLVGYLESSIGTYCRANSEYVVLRWDREPPLYLVNPLNFQFTLEAVAANLEINEPATLSCLAQALELFLPTIPAETPQNAPKEALPQLNALYQGFCKYKDFDTASRFLHLLKCNGWDPLRQAREAKQWDLLGTVLGHLQGANSQLEEVVRTLETVSNESDATPCFEMEFTCPGKRLSKDQKVRVAKAYDTFVKQTGNSAVMRDPLDAKWIFAQLHPWECWLQQHPFENYKQEDRKEWLKAIARIKQTRAFLEKAIDYCWANKAPQVADILELVRAVQKDVKLDFDYEAKLHLQLAKQPNGQLADVGNRWCIDQMGYARSGDLTNTERMFQLYCRNPFVPTDPRVQDAFLDWIDLCMSNEFYTHVPWSERSVLLTALFSFTCPSFKGLEHDHLRIEGLWMMQLLTFRAQKERDRETHSKLFFFHTKLFLDFIFKNYPENNLERINIVRKQILEDFLPHLPAEIKEDWTAQMHLYICSLMFAARPLGADAAVQALTDLNDCVPFLKLGMKEYSEIAVITFRNALPEIMSLDDPRIALLVERVLDNLMTVSWVRVSQTSLAGWLSILTSLCQCLTEETQRAKVAELTSTVFMHCTHPKEVKMLLGEENPLFIDYSLMILGNLFIATPHFECLPTQKWHTLIHGLSNMAMGKMTSGLLADMNHANPNLSYLNTTAVARIIRHTTAADKIFIQTIESLCERGLIRYNALLHKITEPAHKCALMVQWIQALSAHKGLNPSLVTHKLLITHQLTKLVCELIHDAQSYKTYSKFLIEALGNDEEVARTMDTTLQPIENPQLSALKNFVAKKVQPKTPPN